MILDGDGVSVASGFDLGEQVLGLALLPVFLEAVGLDRHIELLLGRLQQLCARERKSQTPPSLAITYWHCTVGGLCHTVRA